jgi:TolA-binding protein
MVTLHVGLLITGFVLQLVGIAKATSKFKEFSKYFRERLKDAVERLRRNGTTGSVNIEMPMPTLNASMHSSPPPDSDLEKIAEWFEDQIGGLSEQVSSVKSDIDKVRDEINMKETDLRAADKRLESDFKTVEHATWLVLFGTGFLFLGELTRLFCH